MERTVLPKCIKIKPDTNLKIFEQSNLSRTNFESICYKFYWQNARRNIYITEKLQKQNIMID